MYGLIKFEENEEGFSVAEASVAMTALEKVGLKIQFADNLLELIDFAGGTVTNPDDLLKLIAMVGGEVTNPEEYEEHRKDQEEVSQRYKDLRTQLIQMHIGKGPEWEAKERFAIERVKASAQIDMAESLAIISGVTR